MKQLRHVVLWALLVAFGATTVTPAVARDDDDDKKKSMSQARIDELRKSGRVGTCDLGAAFKDLDGNNVRARLFNNGGLFWKGSGNVYTVPKTGSANAIFASGIWIAGLTTAGDINTYRFAGTTYGPWEFWPGPLDANGNPPADCSVYDRIFKVTRTDLQEFAATGTATADMTDWPADLGAPFVDANEDGVYNLGDGDLPEVIGEQTAWWVMNDAGNVKGDSQSDPIGLEIQVTAFGFRTADDLNNTTFYKYKMIHKGDADLFDAYFGIWSDPDLGDASDDFVGADTTLGLGFVYNGDDNDGGADGYGDRPPALGYDFFQGPLVNDDGIDNDKDGEIDEDNERIGMTRFVYYNNDSSVLGNPSLDTQEGYNYLRGRWRDGSFMTEGGNGFGGTTPTNFIFPGDPVTQSYWSEENTDGAGARNTPADRRFLLSAGPFTLKRGSVQEIVYGVVWAQGADRLASVAAMRNADALAQAAFDVDFDLPSAPDAPVVSVSNLESQVVLTWSNNPQGNNYLDAYDVENPFIADLGVDDATYTFEGYIIHQYNSQADQNGNIIAVYDVANGVTTVTDVAFDEATGVAIDVVSARGSDSGVKHVHTIDNLVNYKDYFFGVQAYAHNDYSTPKIIKGPVSRLSARPAPVAINGIAYDETNAGELILGSKSATTIGDGVFSAAIVDASKVTGGDYVLSIKAVDSGTTYDITGPSGTVLDGTAYFNRTGGVLPQVDDVIISDGLSFNVTGPQPDIRNFLTVANNAGPLDPPDIGAFAFNSNRFPFWEPAPSEYDDRPTSGYQQVLTDDTWGIHTGRSSAAGQGATYPEFVGRAIRNGWSNIVPFDWEIRFTEACYNAWRAAYDSGENKVANPTADGCYGYDRFGIYDGFSLQHVPFEVWRTGIATPNDPSDDVRMIVATLDWSGDGWGIDPDDHPVSGGTNDPQTDWNYWYLPVNDTPGQAGYDAWLSTLISTCYGEDTSGCNPVTHGAETFARIVFVNWNGANVVDYAFPDGPPDADMPEPGTIFRIVTQKPHNPGDQYTISTAAYAAKSDSTDLAIASLAGTGIVPNPYKGASAYEINLISDEARIVNLPEVATIRVFTLDGTLIRTISKNSTETSIAWDLTTDEGLPMASGMYLVHVDAPELNAEKVIKFGFIKKRIQLDLF